jgi:hypothetical protein
MNRSRLLVGILVLAVVAIGAAIVLSNGGDSAGPEATADLPPCHFASPAGEVGVKNASAPIDCSSSRQIFAAFREAVRSGRAQSGGDAITIEGWSCSESLFAAYPLILHCAQGSQNFDVVGLALHPLSTQEPPPAKSSRAISFQTPNGNIGCRISYHRIRCGIFAAGWTSLQYGGKCAVDHGHLIALGSSGTSIICSNNTVIPPDGESGFPVLKRTMSTSVGPFTCKNHNQALACTSQVSHHGFQVSFQRIKLF